MFYPIWFIGCYKLGFLTHLWHWDNKNPLDSFIAIFIGNGNGIGLILLQLWFLPALLVAEIIFINIFNRLNKFSVEIFVLTVIICSYVGLNLNFLVLPFGMDIALTAQTFLLVGVLIRKYDVVNKMNPKLYCVLVLILIAALFLNERIDMNHRIYGNAMLFYSGGIAGTLLVMKISMLMVAGKFFSLISDCGRQSMIILVLHPIIANIFYDLIVANTDIAPKEFFIEPIIIFGATTLGVLIPLFIAKKFGKLPVLKYFCV